MRLLVFVTALLLSLPALAQPKSVPVVAAENFYGDVARQIGGPNVAVSSILSNPEEDPHLFEASPSVGRALSTARVVIYNGADYDPWMAKLLRAAHSADRHVIIVADLLHRKTGDNPHLWYDPQAMPAVAKALAASLQAADPPHASNYQQDLEKFLDSLHPMDAKIAEMRQRYAGMEVTATEPVFGYMADALGLKMRNERFQLAIMNNTEPRASDVATFEDDLRHHRARAVLYNSQTENNATRRLLKLAQSVGIPVVGVTETEPPGKTYQDWMMDQLGRLDGALAQNPR
ncbi:MAG: metal ABC transporter solute-binding protein [Acetobacteraceae bacterium]|nr:metal ABC transporter solute-binding protein [Acetobacteraceae bacterium]